MANEILSKFTSSTALTISLGGLGNGNARQSTLITNIASSLGKNKTYIYYQIQTGTSPTASTTIGLYLLRGDAASPNITTDNAGTSDAAITLVTAVPFEVITVSSSSDVYYRGTKAIEDVGPLWGVAVLNSTGAPLNATGGNHVIRYVYETNEIQ